MRVLIDDQPCSTPCDTVAEAIEAARTSITSARRVIVEVIVDGQAWNDELASESHLSRKAEEVRLISSDRHDLIRQTLDAAEDAATSADERFQLAAEALQAGRTEEGLRTLQEGVETLHAIQQTISHVAELEEIELEHLLRDHVRPDVASRMRESLEDVRHAIAQEDHVQLADLLMDELPAVTSDLRSVLQMLRERTTNDAGGNATS